METYIRAAQIPLSEKHPCLGRDASDWRSESEPLMSPRSPKVTRHERYRGCCAYKSPGRGCSFSVLARGARVGAARANM